MKTFLFDISRCNGCHNCQIVCKDEHCGNDWSPYAKPQPDTGHFWMYVDEKAHGQTPKVRLEYTPLTCNQCEKPSCMEAAKNDAVYRRDDGIIIIDPEKAWGQKDIVRACPYHAVFWNEDLQIPQKCTGCAHLIDDGQEPRCVEACATDALLYLDEDEIKAKYPEAEVLHPEYGLGPRVYYINRLKKFVAGCVYDSEAVEIIEGAPIRLTNNETGECHVTTTDSFGDFWIKHLPDATYTLEINPSGYEPYLNQNVVLGESINIGDIPFTKDKKSV